MEKINEYLEKYQDLWWRINEHDLPLSCMDSACEMISENNYYGVDFRGDKRVYQMFFLGSSDYFPAIWIGDGSPDDLDKYPCYHLDLSTDTNKFEPIGNFKMYFTKLLDYYEEVCDQNEEEEEDEDVEDARRDLEDFSDEMIDKGDYFLKN